MKLIIIWCDFFKTAVSPCTWQVGCSKHLGKLAALLSVSVVSVSSVVCIVSKDSSTLLALCLGLLSCRIHLGPPLMPETRWARLADTTDQSHQSYEGTAGNPLYNHLFSAHMILNSSSSTLFCPRLFFLLLAILKHPLNPFPLFTSHLLFFLTLPSTFSLMLFLVHLFTMVPLLLSCFFHFSATMFLLSLYICISSLLSTSIPSFRPLTLYLCSLQFCIHHFLYLVINLPYSLLLFPLSSLHCQTSLLLLFALFFFPFHPHPFPPSSSSLLSASSSFSSSMGMWQQTIAPLWSPALSSVSSLHPLLLLLFPPDLFIFTSLVEGAVTMAGYRELELIWNRAHQRDTLSEKERDGETEKKRSWIKKGWRRDKRKEGKKNI